MLHLIEDVARDDCEYSICPTTSLQFGKDDADLEGLAETDRISDEQTGLQLARGDTEWLALEREVVGEHSMPDHHVCCRDRERGSPDETLDHQPRLNARWGAVQAEYRPGRILRLDRIDIREERGALASDEFASPRTPDERTTRDLLLLDLLDLPFLVADDHPRSRREEAENLWISGPPTH